MAENILSAVDTFGDAIAKQLRKTGNQKKSIIKTNLAIEVAVAAKTDIRYPEPEKKSEESSDWIYKSETGLYLQIEYLHGNFSCL